MDNINEQALKYYVNSKNIKYRDKYVCWIDIMGTKNTMLESNDKAANFILRFHQAVLSVKEQFTDMQYYPVMDGVYITTTDSVDMRRMLKALFHDLVDMFCAETINCHRFVVRGSIAFGAVIDGYLISSNVCKMSEDYKQSILLGLPVIQAFQSEREAPPFGLYIHESARKPKELQGRYYSWFNKRESGIDSEMCQSILSYFDWCCKYRLYLQLDESKISKYKEQVNEFFGCLQDGGSTSE